MTPVQGISYPGLVSSMPRSCLQPSYPYKVWHGERSPFRGREEIINHKTWHGADDGGDGASCRANHLLRAISPLYATYA